MIRQNKRTYFLDRPLSYLFSYDLQFGDDVVVGFVAGGVRVDLSGKGQDGDRPHSGNGDETSSLAYHALDDRTVMDNDVVAGKVVWFADRVLVREQTNTGMLDAKITILTEDKALIWSRYQGVLQLGPLGFKRLLGVDDEGNGDTFEAQGFITPRFETDSAKYVWLAARQCVGFGKFRITKGQIGAATFDIYSAG